MAMVSPAVVGAIGGVPSANAAEYPNEATVREIGSEPKNIVSERLNVLLQLGNSCSVYGSYD
jgi:hypothetical protein